MEPGSIVVVLPCKDKIQPKFLPFLKWFPTDDEKTPYMLKTIRPDHGEVFVTFEEGVIGLCTDGSEIELNIKYVREIESTLNVNALMEESKNYQLVETNEYI